VHLLNLAEVRSVRVVLGLHAKEVQAAMPNEVREEVEWVEHPGWAQGRTGSIQAGLSGLPDEAEVVLWPVDHPLVSVTTLPRILRVAEDDRLSVWVLPEYRGRGGHPVILKAAARRAVFELGPEEPLRRLLPYLGPQVRRVPVEDPGVIVNLNTPQDYENARREGLPIGEEPWTGP
jgi:molybdenum cofactor cytidylyltransferase